MKISTANQRQKHIVRSTFNGIVLFSFILLLLPPISANKIPRNYPKILTYSSLRSSKIIDFGAKRKCIFSISH